MQFTQKLVWDAIYHFIPTIRTANKAGLEFNLPTMLKAAAVEAFMKYEDIRAHSDEYLYACVIRRALEELNQIGWMKFGKIDNIEDATLCGAYV